MSKKKALAAIAKQLPSLKKLGVKTIAIFGSVARDKARQNSDVDLLVEFVAPVTIFEFVKLKNYLEKVLKKPVDLVTRDALRPELRKQILREAVRAA